MRELTTIEKTKVKRIFQMTDEEFRKGVWCADKAIVPNGDMVELSYTARNGILVVHDTPNIHIKKLESVTERVGDEDGE